MPASPTPDRLGAMDGLRAIGALAIVLFHLGGLTGINRGGGVGPYFNQLNAGVSLFFVVSGFLLYRPFVASRLAEAGTPPPDIVAYLWRRGLRLFPAYWVVLTVAVYILGYAAIDGARQFVLYYGLAQVYSVDTGLGGLVVTWTLGTEIGFYLYLPVHAWLLRRLDRTRPGGDLDARIGREYAACVALMVASTLFKLVIVGAGADLPALWFPAYADTFALGMVLAVAAVGAERRGHTGPVAATLAAAPARCWALAGLAFAAVANAGMPVGFAPISTGRYLVRQDLHALVGVLLVAPIALGAGAGGWLRSALASRPARWLGLVSYGIFLWHLPLIDQVNDRLRGGARAAPFWELLAPVLVVTVAVAALTWWAVERPAQRLRGRGGPARARAGELR